MNTSHHKFERLPVAMTLATGSVVPRNFRGRKGVKFMYAKGVNLRYLICTLKLILN